MKPIVLCLGLVSALLIAWGCDKLGSPRLAMTTGSGSGEGSWPPVGRSSRKTVYGGKTPDDWGHLLASKDLEEVGDACRALRVLGTEGRPYLIKGLSNPQPETRRLCLETLTVADIRTQGDAGRRLLVRLSGDRDDLRIRERAAIYLAQWGTSAPSR